MRGRTPAEDDANGCYEEGTITEVSPYSSGDGWSVSYGGSWRCGITKDRCPSMPEPKVGDHLRVYGRFGSAFHGQALNGVVLWYWTPEQADADRQAMLARMAAERRERFEAQREQLDRDFDGLPVMFQMRITRFRQANSDFRWEYESYEMFTCVQAALLAEWAVGQTDPDVADWRAEAVAKIDAWERINSKENDPPYDYATYMAAVPGWSNDHSGNTAGCAVMLAKQYILARESVAVLPGAMSPLVGTADYSKRP